MTTEPSRAARLMDGSSTARAIDTETAARAADLEQRRGVRPCLAAVLVGDDPASVTYVKMKQSRCRKVGIDSRLVHLPAASTTDEVVAAVTDLSDDPHVHGILVQHPVPPHVDERVAFEAIAPAKDVDGVTMHSFAAMALGSPTLASCTPAGIVRLLDAYGVDVSGRHAVVIGRSPILGKPIGMLLLSRDATVTYCHSRTRDLAAGDVAFDEAAQKASLITPVPGGVGPMTIAVLLEQTVAAAVRAHD